MLSSTSLVPLDPKPWLCHRAKVAMMTPWLGNDSHSADLSVRGIHWWPGKSRDDWWIPLTKGQSFRFSLLLAILNLLLEKKSSFWWPGKPIDDQWIPLTKGQCFKVFFVISRFWISCWRKSRLNNQMPRHSCHVNVMVKMQDNFDGLVQDCSKSSALAMELLQSCTKASIFYLTEIFSSFWFLFNLPMMRISLKDMECWYSRSVQLFWHCPHAQTVEYGNRASPAFLYWKNREKSELWNCQFKTISMI